MVKVEVIMVCVKEGFGTDLQMAIEDAKKASGCIEVKEVKVIDKK